MRATTRLRTATPLAALAVAVGLLALTGCGPTGDDTERISAGDGPQFPVFETDPDVPVLEDVVYGRAAGTDLLLDACLPPGSDSDDADAAGADADGLADSGNPGTGDTDPAELPGASGTTAPRPAILLVHGGSWTRGDKADLAWRSTCQWLAKSGYVAFSANYRLAPEHPFPAAIDDLERAVTWLRDPAQVERFGIDPDRIGAFGGSAGGNLVSLLATSGTGPTTEGTRVSAVVDLSGPIDLTGADATADFIPVQLQYLGCPEQAACPSARTASPIFHVDETDPPFFVAHSVDEFIPIAQSRRFVTALRDAGVDTTFVTLDGTLHSISMVDDELRGRILEFLDSRLAGKLPGVVP
ncbi:MAG: alpha/beta hydrolase [Microbacteriaceae bacterium]